MINSVTKLHLVGYLYWVILRCTDPWILNFVCQFVCLCVHISMAPDRFLWYLILGMFTKICLETPNLVKMKQKYWALYMETWLLYSVGSSMTYCLALLLWYWCSCCTYRSKDSSLLGCWTLSLGECFLILWGHNDHTKRWEILNDTACHSRRLESLATLL